MHDTRATAPERGSLARAALWMTVLSVLLFWLPILGPAIAGFVGGRYARTIGKAILAAFVPALLLAVLVVVVLSAFELPLIGAVAGIGVFLIILAEDIPMFIGAIAGAALR